jgi:hypothetical protein
MTVQVIKLVLQHELLWMGHNLLYMYELQIYHAVICKLIRKLQWPGYNWATLFLGELNTGTWPPGWGSLRKRDSKICS